MKKIFLWFPVFFWMGLIFFLSSQPKVTIFEQELIMFLISKTGHILEYGILFLLIYRATEKNLLLSFTLTIIYAFSDEIHQLFVPTREGRLRDVLIDGFGAFLGSLVVKRKEKK